MCQGATGLDERASKSEIGTSRRFVLRRGLVIRSCTACLRGTSAEKKVKTLFLGRTSELFGSALVAMNRSRRATVSCFVVVGTDPTSTSKQRARARLSSQTQEKKYIACEIASRSLPFERPSRSRRTQPTPCIANVTSRRSRASMIR